MIGAKALPVLSLPLAALLAVGCGSSRPSAGAASRTPATTPMPMPASASRPTSADRQQSAAAPDTDAGRPHGPLQRALHAAWERDPVLRGLEAEAAIADHLTTDAGRLRNPEVRLRQHRDADLSGAEGLDAAVRWKPPRPGEREAERMHAEAEAGIIHAEARQRRRTVGDEVHAAWLETRTLARLAGIDRRQLALQAERAALLERQVALGVRTRPDQVEATLRRLAVDERRERLERDLRQAEHALRSLVGEEVELPTDEADGADAPSDADIAAPPASAAAPPEADIAAWGERDALAALQAARWGAVPWTTFVEVGADFDDRGVGEGTSVRVGIELPLFDRQRGAVLAARLQARHQHDQHRRALAAADLAARQAQADLVAARAERQRLVEALRVVDAELDALMGGPESHRIDPLLLIDLRIRRLDGERALVERDAEVARCAWHAGAAPGR